MFEHHRPHPQMHMPGFRSHRAVRRALTGTALILFGSGWLLRNQGLITREQLWLIAPAFLALIGLARLAFARDAATVLRGVLALAMATYLTLVIEHVGGITFAATWPVLLIAAGLGNIARAMAGRRDDGCKEPNW